MDVPGDDDEIRTIEARPPSHRHARGRHCLGLADEFRDGRRARGRLSPVEEAVFARRSRGIIVDFVSVARAVRQIIVLEQELAGLRPTRRGVPGPKDALPDLPGLPELSALPALKTLPQIFPARVGDDLHEYYDTQPVGEAVGWIRETLRIDAPANDPFMIRPSMIRQGRAEPAASETVETAEAEPQDLRAIARCCEAADGDARVDP